MCLCMYYHEMFEKLRSCILYGNKLIELNFTLFSYEIMPVSHEFQSRTTSFQVKVICYLFNERIGTLFLMNDANHSSYVRPG